MAHYLTYGMVYLGASLMIYNIYGFITFARRIRSRTSWDDGKAILYVPILLLLLFLLGYLLAGQWGRLDLIISSILFGGSIFVFVMYLLLNSITNKIIESEQREVELKAAEESSREKNEILAAISHEMRTPMNVILGIDGIALKNPSLPQETREQLEKIGRSGRHLLGLINNALEMQTLETGQLSAKREPFCLLDAIEQINAITGTLCEGKKLTYHSDISPRLPEYVTGDELMLKQTLLSLLDNAVKFTDAPGTVSFTVEPLSIEDRKCQIKLSVQDTGVGMSPEFLSKAFDLFAQEDCSFTNRFGGSGLGLPSAKNKVGLMGGTISAESEKNVGSVFTVVLPFQLPPQPEGPATPPASEVSLQNRRVLIVDDVEENAEIAADLLEMEGVCTERAENGQAALDMFSQSAPGYYDAVLMDLRMPVMDGLEAARRIRNLNRPDAKTVPVIALTANDSEADMQHSLEAGMNAHLVKPVDAELLYESLKKWIGTALETTKGGN